MVEPPNSSSTLPEGLPTWSSHYPDPQLLRREASSMADAFLDAVREAIPASEIEGIYLKGSAIKPWDSPVDYVPELSDVDMHLLLKDEALTRYLGSLEQALIVQARAEELYKARVVSPLHFPRPQLVLANNLFPQPDFVPSPPGMVRVVQGKPYPMFTGDDAAVRRIDLRNLLSHETYLTGLPLDVIDKPGRYLYLALRGLSWRASPTGPRVLSVLGVPYKQAWGVNRTEVVRQLLSLGEKQLAADYSAFYLHGWEYFLSGYEDSNAGRAVLLAGARVLRRGIEIARSRLAEPEYLPG